MYESDDESLSSFESGSETAADQASEQPQSAAPKPSETDQQAPIGGILIRPETPEPGVFSAPEVQRLNFERTRAFGLSSEPADEPSSQEAVARVWAPKPDSTGNAGDDSGSDLQVVAHQEANPLISSDIGREVDYTTKPYQQAEASEAIDTVGQMVGEKDFRIDHSEASDTEKVGPNASQEVVGGLALTPEDAVAIYYHQNEALKARDGEVIADLEKALEMSRQGIPGSRALVEQALARLKSQLEKPDTQPLAADESFPTIEEIERKLNYESGYQLISQCFRDSTDAILYYRGLKKLAEEGRLYVTQNDLLLSYVLDANLAQKNRPLHVYAETDEEADRLSAEIAPKVVKGLEEGDPKVIDALIRLRQFQEKEERIRRDLDPNSPVVQENRGVPEIKSERARVAVLLSRDSYMINKEEQVNLLSRFEQATRLNSGERIGSISFGPRDVQDINWDEILK